MAPKLRIGALAALLALATGCGGSGGGGSGQVNAVSVTVTCTPDFVEKLGTSQCAAIIDGSPADENDIEWSASAGSIDADGQFIAPETAGNVTITARHVQTADSGGLTVVISGARSLADQPDSGVSSQVHVLYVLPADGEDRTLDTDGTIALSVEAWNEWFAGQTGDRRLRLDRAAGALDISFVRLSRSNAEMNAFGPELRDQIEGELVARGFDDPDKVYLAYYDGGDAAVGTCGDAAWPPLLPGSVAAVFLQAIPTSGNPCGENEFADAVDAPGYIEFAALREVIRVLGIVPECAPRHVFAGSVSDGPTDLMYAGDEEWNPSVLDIGRNDYFEATGIANCLDLAESSFIDPLPVPSVVPPGWPYATLPVINCAQEGLLQPEPGVETSIQFLNSTAGSANIYRLVETANGDVVRDIVRQVRGYEGFLERTETMQPFVVTTDTNECLGIFIGTSESMGRAVVRSP